jgi:hypothetical protein
MWLRKRIRTMEGLAAPTGTVVWFHSGLSAGRRFRLTAKSEADETARALIVRAVAAG